jgi:predicted phosphodiesterase
MRLAVLSDIHGNLQALEAVLEHAQKQKVDQIIIAGDLVNVLPDSRACWDLVKSLNLPMVRGNHERYVFHYDTAFANPNWYEENFNGLALVVQEFSEDERKEMATLPLHLHLEDLLVVHASYQSDNDTVTAETPSADLEKMFAGTSERYILRGHNHHRYRVNFNGRYIDTIGSAGLPLDGTPEAKYVITEKSGEQWVVRDQQVAYDHAATVRRLETSVFMQLNPVYKIFLRELVTSRGHVVRFWQEYDIWSKSKTLSLEQAVAAFLAA